MTRDVPLRPAVPGRHRRDARSVARPARPPVVPRQASKPALETTGPTADGTGPAAAWAGAGTSAQARPPAPEQARPPAPTDPPDIAADRSTVDGSSADRSTAGRTTADGSSVTAAPSDAAPTATPGPTAPTTPTPAAPPTTATPNDPTTTTPDLATSSPTTPADLATTPTPAAPATTATLNDPAGPPPRPGWRGWPGRGWRAVRRMPPPHRLALRAARGTVAWARRPAGRLVLPGIMIGLLLCLTGAAGAYLVPAQVEARATGSPSPTPATGSASSDPLGAAPPLVPGGTPTLPATPLPTGTAPSVNPLADWAAQLTTKVDIPVVALQAYGNAELLVAQSTPACRLSWTTLAAIGKVESNHGRANNATLGADGRSLPAIIGPPLDGTNGTVRVPDTDDGLLDHDTVWDRAIGPMQFIPQTWQTQSVDADGDNIRDPYDIDDAALAAGNYLCAGGRDLSTAAGWWEAIASYNMPQSYGDSVFTQANTYGQASRG